MECINGVPLLDVFPVLDERELDEYVCTIFEELEEYRKGGRVHPLLREYFDMLLFEGDSDGESEEDCIASGAVHLSIMATVDRELRSKIRVGAVPLWRLIEANTAEIVCHRGTDWLAVASEAQYELLKDRVTLERLSVRVRAWEELYHEKVVVVQNTDQASEERVRGEVLLQLRAMAGDEFSFITAADRRDLSHLVMCTGHSLSPMRLVTTLTREAVALFEPDWSSNTMPKVFAVYAHDKVEHVCHLFPNVGDDDGSHVCLLPDLNPTRALTCIVRVNSTGETGGGRKKRTLERVASRFEPPRLHVD